MKTIDVTTLKAYQGFPTVQSGDEAWIKWVDMLESKYGEYNASRIFLALWLKRGSDKANTVNLRHTLASKYHIQIDESVWNKAADLGGGIGRTVSGIFKTGKYITMVVGGSLVLITLYALFNIAKHSDSVATNLIAAKTGGAK